MTDRDFEFVRGLLIKARNSGESNEGLKEGRIVGNAESIDDAVSELDDRGVYTTVEELSDFINAFILSTCPSTSAILASNLSFKAVKLSYSTPFITTFLGVGARLLTN